MNNKKRNILLVVISIVIFIFILWISGIIPKQIARISASHYLKKNLPKLQLEYLDVQWSSSFGAYLIRFKDENNKIYSFFMNGKYFPISPGQGTFALEEEYKEKYIEENEITNIESFYARNITKGYKDIRNLSENYSLEQAQRDNCFTIGAMVHNDNLYTEFMNKYNEKNSAFIRVAQSTVEGDTYLIDLLYDNKKDMVYLVKDNTRDKFSIEEYRTITLKKYKKTGVWNYQNSEYWVVYNGELPDGTIAQYSINSDELFIIAIL